MLAGRLVPCHRPRRQLLGPRQSQLQHSKRLRSELRIMKLVMPDDPVRGLRADRDIGQMLVRNIRLQQRRNRHFQRRATRRNRLQRQLRRRYDLGLTQSDSVRNHGPDRQGRAKHRHKPRVTPAHRSPLARHHHPPTKAQGRRNDGRSGAARQQTASDVRDLFKRKRQSQPRRADPFRGRWERCDHKSPLPLADASGYRLNSSPYGATRSYAVSFS